MAKVWSGTKNLVGKPFNRGHKTDDADYKAFEQAFTSQYKALQSLNKDVNSFLCSIDGKFVNYFGSCLVDFSVLTLFKHNSDETLSF